MASKNRRTKAPTFTSPPSSSTPSTSTPLDATLRHTTPSNTSRGGPHTTLPTPGTSTLAKSALGNAREPPLVEAARRKSVKQRNVFDSYLGESAESHSRSEEFRLIDIPEKQC